jgi:hypothetical protein
MIESGLIDPSELPSDPPPEAADNPEPLTQIGDEAATASIEAQQCPALPFHPLAELFPLLGGADFDSLVDDIRTNGLNEPVIMHKGRILDGRNRYRACQSAGVDPRFREFEGTDPVAFVVSANVHRRHLNESQRSMIAAELTRLGEENEARGEPANLPVPLNSPPLARLTQPRAAKLMNISERSVRTASKVCSDGIPTLVEKVKQGEIAVSAAARVARLPSDEQQKIIANGKRAITAAPRQDRKRGKRSSDPGNAEETRQSSLPFSPAQPSDDSVQGQRAAPGEERHEAAPADHAEPTCTSESIDKKINDALRELAGNYASKISNDLRDVLASPPCKAARTTFMKHLIHAINEAHDPVGSKA